MALHLRPLQAVFLLAALCVLPAYATPTRDDDAVSHRVFYLFDPAAASQLERADQIRRHTGGLAGVEWIGITRGPAQGVVFPHRRATELLASGTMTTTARLWLQSHAADPEPQDQILVEHRTTARAFAGAGVDAPRVMADAGLPGGARTSTDVGVTTWGKVKDLFR